jgi:hypothetical protein
MHDLLQAHWHGGFRRDAGRLPAALLLLQAHIAAAAICTTAATDAGGWLSIVRRSRRRTPQHQLWHCFMMMEPTAGRCTTIKVRLQMVSPTAGTHSSLLAVSDWPQMWRPGAQLPVCAAGRCILLRPHIIGLGHHLQVPARRSKSVDRWLSYAQCDT